jgi:hypothetical protein
MTELVPLSDADKARFREDGFLILPGVLDPREVAHVSESGDRLHAEATGGFRLNHDSWDGISNCIARDPAFHPLLTCARVLSAVMQLLSPRIHLLSSQYISSRALAPDEAARWKPLWHRDLFGTSRDLGSENLPLMAIKCGFMLTDHLEPDSGMTLFAPGTHLHRRGPMVPEGQAHPPRVIEPRVRAGDVILFENRIGHSRGRNTSGRTRRCVMLNFGYRWLMPYDYVSYDEAFRARLSPLARALLAAPRFPMPPEDPVDRLLAWAGALAQPGRAGAGA